MGLSSFWDNQEKAQQIIGQLKLLNGLLNPYEALEESAGDLRALAELAEEDDSLDAELEAELGKIENASTISRCNRCCPARKTAATPS